jgi:hypothetical protein
MVQTQLIGYGRFHLEQFQPGEQFARFDGSLGQVCKDQPYQQLHPVSGLPWMPNYLLAWIDYGTSNAFKILLHRHAFVHAVSADQARLLEARSRR